MTDKIICEKCGAEMLDLSSGHSIHVECPKCGWSWATTVYDPSENDETAYEIWLTPGNSQTMEILRLIAKIANVNFLQAKKMLGKDSNVLLFKAHSEAVTVWSKVQQIQNIARQLANANIAFSIVPDFPYDY